MNRLLRYGLASVGPVGTAGAQFLLSLALLRALPAPEFGSFSFLLVASILATSLWSALFCAPLVVFLGNPDDLVGRQSIHAIFATSLAGMVAAFAVFVAMSLALHLTIGAALAFAAFAALGLMRWLGRSFSYGTGHPLRSTVSDIVYTVVLLAAAGYILFVRAFTIESVFAAMAMAMVAGLAVLGPDFARACFHSFGPRALLDYRSVWRTHSGWSLLGVLSTEATVNCHAYIVTAIKGPAAFAPIAATQLLLRPLTVTINALVEFERAQMARSIGAGRPEDAVAAVRMMRWVLIALCTALAAASAALLYYAPRLVFPPQYSVEVLAIGGASWLAVGYIRAMRAPDSALLQAAGAFRPLAFASVYSAGISIITVVALVVANLPLWSILGVLSGELVFLFWLVRAVNSWIAQKHGGKHPFPTGGEASA